MAEGDRWLARARPAAGVLENKFRQRDFIPPGPAATLDGEARSNNARLCGNERVLSNGNDEDHCRECDLATEHGTRLDLSGRSFCSR